ncbi:pyridoxamine 5'-phosphate oxidase family protein [Collimonas fungivorans]|uniref:Phosphohydrolase (MutT/nudix family protein) n=1 Tax=Collimonas fungivorans (strain Ter331) TaxID=1005048 RepID=G0A8J4_COLFT|nr:pyridoxamine 5'-phosphate oxidase family protein [Collimonas fungivorans]AEK61467.1 Phosphohydrolase (MutT/nudix family protein) [Collimonas fungivorans Ter331]
MLTTIEQLEEIYGKPHERSLWKEIDYLNEDYQAFVKTSPFVVFASHGPGGMDCSPKGDAPGFVKILDERTLAVPDRPGNNRIDTLRNLIADPRIALLFIVPGIGETLRVNGRAEISAEPALLEQFAVDGKLPRTVIIVKVEATYFHCSKALVRSKLWDPAGQIERSSFPSPGAMLKRLGSSSFDAEAYDRELPARVKATLY